MHSEDVRKILNSIGKLLDLDSKSANGVSACTIESKEFNPEEMISGWTAKINDTNADEPRSIALLAAYKIIFGAGILAKGMQTSDGKWFRPDIAVVRACLRSGEMILTDTKPRALRITDSGSKKIAAAFVALAAKHAKNV